MSLIEILSTRELAWFSWGLIALLVCLFSASTRNSIWEIIKAFFNWKLFRIWLLMLFYIAQWTFLLWYFNLWTTGLLKDTIFFLLFSASITFFKANKIDKEKHFFREMLKDNIKLGIFMEFLVGLYTFSFLTEFLILPIGVFLSLLLALAESDVKFIKVKKLINAILTLIGLYLIYHIILAAIRHYKELFVLENLKEIIFAPIYTLLFIPFLYLLSIYMVYEVQHIILDTAIKVPSLKWLAKKYAFRYFINDVEGLKRWVRRVRFVNPRTEAELITSITQLKSHLLLEKSPPVINIDKGWSPYLAVNFMDNNQLKAGNYDCTFDNEWGACSNYLYIGDDNLMNTLSYYVNGNETTAMSLDLTLKVFNPHEPADMHLQFLDHAQILFNKATQQELPQKMVIAIIKGNPVRILYQYCSIELKKEKWQNLTHGYDLSFSISNIQQTKLTLLES